MSVVDISSNNSRFVSPFVTQYEPGAYINVDSELTEVVTVSGINQTFKYSLSDIDLDNFLAGFKVSGVTVDTRMGEVDVNYASNWDVTMGEEVATKAAFKSALDKIIGDAVSDASHNLIESINSTVVGYESDKTIASYLHSQLYNAFVTAFGGMLGTDSAAIGGQDNNAPNTPTSSAAAGQSSSSADIATDAMTGVNAATSTLSTKINSFSVYVDMDASAAAADMIEQHKDQTSSAALKSLFRQIPRSTLEQYLPKTGGVLDAGAEQALSTTSLPVLKGDKLVFVFDIDVKAAGPNTVGAEGTAAGGEDIGAATTQAPEDVPVAGNQNTNYGVSSLSLNLANRRVAIEITLGSGGGPF